VWGLHLEPKVAMPSESFSLSESRYQFNVSLPPVLITIPPAHAGQFTAHSHPSLVHSWAFTRPAGISPNPSGRLRDPQGEITSKPSGRPSHPKRDITSNPSGRFSHTQGEITSKVSGDPVTPNVRSRQTPVCDPVISNGRTYQRPVGDQVTPREIIPNPRGRSSHPRWEIITNPRGRSSHPQGRSSQTPVGDSVIHKGDYLKPHKATQPL